MDTTRKQPTGWLKLVLGVVLSIVTLVAQTLAIIVAVMAFHLDVDNTAVFTAGELFGGVVALLFVIALGGWLYARPTVRGFSFAFRAAAVVLVLDVLIAALALFGSLNPASDTSIDPHWPLNVLVVGVLCLGVGMFEEGVFRGLLLQGLLARMGTNKRGIVGAIVISSVLFGLVHVIDPVGTVDTLSIAQMALKTLQTGMLGFILAVIVLKTHSLWGAIVIHALNDFILLFVSSGLLNEPISTDYVMEGDVGVSLVTAYVIFCLLYLPSFIYCVRELRRMSIPKRGPFYRVRSYPGQLIQAQQDANFGPEVAHQDIAQQTSAADLAPNASLPLDVSLPVPPSRL